MGALISFFAKFLSPLVVASLGLFSIITFLITALADPAGQWNQIVNAAIDLISGFFPATPTELKIKYLLGQVDGLPTIASFVICQILGALAQFFALAAIIKIYRLIPFKAT